MWTLVTLALLTANVGNILTAEKFETIITPPTTHLVQSKYDFSSYNYVKFQVKACDTTAFLSIGKMQPNGLFYKDYHLVLGGGPLNNENVLYVITGGFQQPEAILRRKLLDCNKFVQFYIKWRGAGGLLEFGTANQVLLTLKDPKYRTRPVSPDVGVYTSEAQGVFRIFNPQLVPRDCCSTAGNTYCVVPDMNCKFFTQRGTHGSTYLHKCPKGTRFNTVGERCYCDHIATTPCSI